MQKTFSISIPNELFVNDYSENKELVLTYNGPSVLYVNVTRSGLINSYQTEEPEELDNTDSLSFYTELDANVNTSVAFWLTTKYNEHVMEFEDEINHDGSIYQKPVNPRIHDYYDLKYHIGSRLITENGINNGPWVFELFTKELRFPEEDEAVRNLSYVQSKLSGYDLEEPYLSSYNNFISNTQAYLSIMEPLCPWKYVKVTNPSVPKIPLNLVKLIKELSVTNV